MLSTVSYNAQARYNLLCDIGGEIKVESDA